MSFKTKFEQYHPSPLLKTVQMTLLVLIIIGIGLLATQKLWVPKLVDYILKNEIAEKYSSVIISDTAPDEMGTLPAPGTTGKATTSVPETRPGKVDTGVEGIVTIGPVCPVVRYPADGNPPPTTCDDRTYETTLLIKSTTQGEGDNILVHTDREGYFSTELAPGTYTISAAKENMLPSLSPVTFQITPHTLVSLNLVFDSGIR